MFCVSKGTSFILFYTQNIICQAQNVPKVLPKRGREEADRDYPTSITAEAQRAQREIDGA
jgi:hypothetical protein